MNDLTAASNWSSAARSSDRPGEPLIAHVGEAQAGDGNAEVPQCAGCRWRLCG
jgi:hypothetical protein